jgi:hypothetical protein
MIREEDLEIEYQLQALEEAIITMGADIQTIKEKINIMEKQKGSDKW